MVANDIKTVKNKKATGKPSLNISPKRNPPKPKLTNSKNTLIPIACPRRCESKSLTIPVNKGWGHPIAKS